VVHQPGSIGSQNFNLVKEFLSRLVGRLAIDSGHTRVGLVKFATNVGVRTGFNLNTHSTTSAVQSAISSLPYSYGGTNTHKALKHVRTSMLTAAAGDRRNVSNVVVVLTVGDSNYPKFTQVSLHCTLRAIITF